MYRLEPKCIDCGTKEGISPFFHVFWICDLCRKKRAELSAFHWRHRAEDGCRNCRFLRVWEKRCAWDYHVVINEEIENGCKQRNPNFVKRLVNGKPAIISAEYADSYPAIKEN